MKIKDVIEYILTPLYGLIYLFAVGFLFLNTLTNPADDVAESRLLTILAIAIIMICPALVNRMYQAGNMRRSSSRWLMVIAYSFTILIVGLSAISWYLFPDNGRWEPLTLILGFTVSWITLLQRSWLVEDRIFTVFNIADE